MAPAHAHPRAAPTASQEADLVARLRAGDERAFEALVDRHYGMMLAVARGYVRTRAVAEEVVQDTWLAVVEGVDRFEQRSSLKTWIYRILMNKARTRGRNNSQRPSTRTSGAGVQSFPCSNRVCVGKWYCGIAAARPARQARSTDSTRGQSMARG